MATGEELHVLSENKFICKEDYNNSKLSSETGNLVNPANYYTRSIVTSY